MRWPWKSAKETVEAEEHKKEIADVTERLDVVVKDAVRLTGRVDLIEDELAVYQRNGPTEATS